MIRRVVEARVQQERLLGASAFLDASEYPRASPLLERKSRRLADALSADRVSPVAIGTRDQEVVPVVGEPGVVEMLAYAVPSLCTLFRAKVLDVDRLVGVQRGFAVRALPVEQPQEIWNAAFPDRR